MRNPLKNELNEKEGEDASTPSDPSGSSPPTDAKENDGVRERESENEANPRNPDSVNNLTDHAEQTQESNMNNEEIFSLMRSADSVVDPEMVKKVSL